MWKATKIPKQITVRYALQAFQNKHQIVSKIGIFRPNHVVIVTHQTLYNITNVFKLSQILLAADMFDGNNTFSHVTIRMQLLFFFVFNEGHGNEKWIDDHHWCVRIFFESISEQNVVTSKYFFYYRVSFQTAIDRY